jgi:hypothetical protein
MLNFIKCFERVLIKIISDLFLDTTLYSQWGRQDAALIEMVIE